MGRDQTACTQSASLFKVHVFRDHHRHLPLVRNVLNRLQGTPADLNCPGLRTHSTQRDHPPMAATKTWPWKRAGRSNIACRSGARATAHPVQEKLDRTPPVGTPKHLFRRLPAQFGHGQAHPLIYPRPNVKRSCRHVATFPQQGSQLARDAPSALKLSTGFHAHPRRHSAT